ncbi:hypothetical protein PtA15_13A420 [Puccinia triticina]|uniref:Alpha-galactosidase n=1 Tax=Puccinia triticina TaxID=208348 RepID=A0ABY7D2A2_9BASI|nr:uncharacterized protein PtA15_13A420 [Puccinia triticina]WAQ91020.1 hypothetical protein PtA15_13A420 [Puccinia triticina]
MDKFSFYKIKWLSVAIFMFSTIGLTTQTPVEIVLHNAAQGPRVKPVMGWNSFYPFGCGKHVKIKGLKWQADLMAQKGFIKAGYTTFIIECGWEAGSTHIPFAPHYDLIYKHRVLGNYAHFREDFRGRQLRLGFGTWAGPQICPRYEGENSHAKSKKNLQAYMHVLFKALGATYISHRPCDWAKPEILQNPDSANQVNSRYIEMESELAKTGSRNEIFYATGQWGASPSAKDTKANSWRIADDTLDNWNSFIRTLNALYPYSLSNKGPYNDLGFLQFGENKLTMAEKRTQFCFWAAAKSPLIISTDISRLSQEEIELLTNPRAIAINQDNLGKSITLNRRYPADMDIWSGPLSDGSTVAIIINWSDDSSQKTIQLEDLGFSSAHVVDVLTQKDRGIINKTLITTIDKHGCLLIKLTETRPALKRNFQDFPVEVAEIKGSATIKLTSQGVKVAGNLMPDGKSGVRWSKIPGSKNGPTLVRLSYINADLSPGNMDDSKLNFKHTAFIINNSAPYYADLPITGLTWDDMAEGFLVALPLKPGENTIFIQGEAGQYAPDFHKLSVEKTE